MKFLITVIIVVGLALGAYQLYQYWGNFQQKDTTTQQATPTIDSGDQLPGMTPRLQPVLEAAEQRGANGLHDFLTMYGNSIGDPRKAWIELDYVVLVARTNPGEARRVFAKVKSRTPENSPVYGRIKQLEKTYE